MGKMTFVVDFPDGKEPAVSADNDILGGKLVSVAFHDAVESADYMAAFLGYLQEGMSWFEALLGVSADNDWKFQEIDRRHAKLAVPADQVASVEKLMAGIVPVTFQIDVTARKQPGIVENLHS